jgi:hypothetical protein
MNVHVREAVMADSESLEQAAKRVAAALRAGEGLPVEATQDLLAAGVSAFAARRLGARRHRHRCRHHHHGHPRGREHRHLRARPVADDGHQEIARPPGPAIQLPTAGGPHGPPFLLRRAVRAAARTWPYISEIGQKSPYLFYRQIKWG